MYVQTFVKGGLRQGHVIEPVEKSGIKGYGHRRIRERVVHRFSIGLWSHVKRIHENYGNLAQSVQRVPSAALTWETLSRPNIGRIGLKRIIVEKHINEVVK